MTKIYSWLDCIAALVFQKFLVRVYFCAQIPLNKGFCSLNILGFWRGFTEADKAKLKKCVVLHHTSFNNIFCVYMWAPPCTHFSLSLQCISLYITAYPDLKSKASTRFSENWVETAVLLPSKPVLAQFSH